MAKSDMENQIIYWNGEDGLRWKAQMGIVDQKPCIVELGYEKNNQWFLVGNMLTPQFKVVTGKRTTHNPQREKPVGADEKPDYQWDTYSDDPFSKKDVKEAVQEWNTTQMSVKVLLPGEDSWLKGEDVTGGTFILVKNGEYGETSQETNESAGSAMGYAARPGTDAAVPERAVPDGIRLPAKRTTAGETAVISFWGDFGEYAKQKDGVEYDVYFVMETAQGLTFVSAPDPLGEFCYGEDSSSVGTSGGGLYPVF